MAFLGKSPIAQFLFICDVYCILMYIFQHRPHFMLPPSPDNNKFDQGAVLHTTVLLQYHTLACKQNTCLQLKVGFWCNLLNVCLITFKCIAHCVCSMFFLPSPPNLYLQRRPLRKLKGLPFIFSITGLDDVRSPPLGTRLCSLLFLCLPLFSRLR